MILVLLGTQKHQFTRLLDALETDLVSGQIKETVLVQNGHTDFESTHMELIGFVEENSLDALIQKADLVICHGGAGSIFKCLEYGKKVIAVARRAQTSEHFNDHQIEIVQRLSDLGYILAANETLSLAQTIQQAALFDPKPFVSNTQNIVGKIRSFIDEQT
ncbi:MAG: exopolysaccharide biosynthesis protein [Erysipelotrichaceae bacterium]|nr:exopolysaccharide biosynthesis protein [Erysipelotrichaceae bacterium]